MIERLVPRYTIGNNGVLFDEAGLATEAFGCGVVTDADAAKLEAVVVAAKAMGNWVACCTASEFAPRSEWETKEPCGCVSCEACRAFDAALAKLEGK